MDKKTLWIAGAAGAAMLFLMMRRGGGAAIAQTTVDPTGIIPGAFMGVPAYVPGTVANIGGVGSINAGDYISAFTSAPASGTPSIGLVPEIANSGGISSSSVMNVSRSSKSLSGGYSIGGFGIGGGFSRSELNQNLLANTSSNVAQKITFAA